MPDPAKSSLLNNIGWLLANAKHFNPNERRFLPSAGNFLHRGITLSRKQYAWLNSIYIENATGSRGRIGGGGYGRCLPGGRHEGRARQFELRGLWGGGT